MPPYSTLLEFKVFHTQNPEIYELIVMYARQAKAAGKETYGADAIYNRMRWHVEIDVISQTPYKLNNNYISLYSRMAMFKNKDLDGFFRLRNDDQLEFKIFYEWLKKGFI